MNWFNLVVKNGIGEFYGHPDLVKSVPSPNPAAPVILMEEALDRVQASEAVS